MSERDEPRRLSVDLDPGLYKQFTEWAARAAEDTHIHRVKLTDALRAMITVTATDAEMSNAVVTEMTAAKWTPRVTGCLEQMIDDASAWRTATREPNRVELVGGPYGLNQWVDVSTPAVLAMVSASRKYAYPPVNGVARTDEADSVVRIRAREGWSFEVTHEERNGWKEMVIRFAEAAPAAESAEIP